MADKMYTVQLTRDEMERVATIIAYNIDCNLTRKRDREITQKRMNDALQIEKRIQADQALMGKFLNA